MSTTTATQDDDLIILSDNISSTFGTEPVISQDINFTDNNSVISFDTPDMDASTKIEPPIFGEILVNPENILNQETPVIFEDSTPEIIPEVQQGEQIETKELDNSINNLFGDLSTQSTPIIVENPQKVEDSSVNNVFSLDINNETTPDDSIGDMNTILNNTIMKLKSRQTGSEGKKSIKITTINELETKIKELREQSTVLKREIVFLDEESIKIDINVGNLESMKMGKTSKVASKAREHNTEKVTKQIKP